MPRLVTAISGYAVWWVPSVTRVDVQVASADSRDLFVAGAEAARDRLVLDPLVLGARDRGRAQDRQLAPPRVELALAEDRAAEAQQRAHGGVGMGDRAEDVQRREELERFTDRRGRGGGCRR